MHRLEKIAQLLAGLIVAKGWIIQKVTPVAMPGLSHADAPSSLREHAREPQEVQRVNVWA